MKNILGLDLGTNSIGWALVQHDINDKSGKIVGAGSRIIPMDQAQMGDFNKGVINSATAERTKYRGTRRLYERAKLRRQRLHRVLHICNCLPDHYAAAIDFEVRKGQFRREVKLNYAKEQDGVYRFLFPDSFDEMATQFKQTGYDGPLPQDWTLYYLRKKALSQEISRQELAWVLLSFNQKRGYYQLRGDELESADDDSKEYAELQIVDIAKDEDNGQWYNLALSNGDIYKRKFSEFPDDWVGVTKPFIITRKKTKSGDVKTSYSSPKEGDWGLVKKKTEQAIGKSGKHVGEYIFDILLRSPDTKIIGKTVKTIDR